MQIINILLVLVFTCTTVYWQYWLGVFKSREE